MTTVRSATPYLILNGAAERAIAFYERALGAKATSLLRFGDVDKSCPEARRNAVMHAELRVGDALLMMSDGQGDGPPPNGGAVSVALDFADPAELRRCFDALAETGKPIEPPMEAPWGAIFAAVNDEFGVSWMLNCALKRG